jgi:hypothetical protein
MRQSGNKNAEAKARLEALLSQSRQDAHDTRAKDKANAASHALAIKDDIVENIKKADNHLVAHPDEEGRATGQRRTVPGSEWANAGQTPGTFVWRIQNFKVVPIPASEYGTFYDGDSYIVLHTRKNGDALAWDIHFWLGEHTTQDESGTAAYKTVELDDKLGGAPVQHREIQGFESSAFLSYFNNTIQILSGGFDSGFHHVTPENYRSRLLHIKGRTKHRVEEVPLSYKSLNSGDSFLLDGGLKLHVWQGKSSNVGEKHKAIQVANAIRDERVEVAPVETHINVEGEETEEFWNLLGGKGPIAGADVAGDDFEQQRAGVRRLCRLSDASGHLTFTEIATGDAVKENLLDGNDVFIFDTGAEVFAWVGRRASGAERKNALQYAQDYLQKYNRPPYLSIAKIFEGGENEVFREALRG